VIVFARPSKQLPVIIIKVPHGAENEGAVSEGSELDSVTGTTLMYFRHQDYHLAF